MCATASAFSVGGAVQVFWFVAKNVAVGLSGSASYKNSRFYDDVGDLSGSRHALAFVGPTVGYNVALGRFASFFPQLGVDAGYVSIHAHVLEAGATAPPRPLSPVSNSSFDSEIRLYAPLLLHPVQHSYLGLGPYFSHDFTPRRSKPDIGTNTLHLGVALQVGGYFGGDLPPEEANAAPPRRFRGHLGDDGTSISRDIQNTRGDSAEQNPSTAYGASMELGTWL